jgi:hypothetical protein
MCQGKRKKANLDTLVSTVDGYVLNPSFRGCWFTRIESHEADTGKLFEDTAKVLVTKSNPNFN